MRRCKEFNQAYEGTNERSGGDAPGVPGLLAEIPRSCRVSLPRFQAHFSAEIATAKWLRGVFFCFALPALDKELASSPRRQVPRAGTSRMWIREAFSEEPARSSRAIRSDASKRPRVCIMDRAHVDRIRDVVLKHIKNTYLNGWMLRWAWNLCLAVLDGVE